MIAQRTQRRAVARPAPAQPRTIHGYRVLTREAVVSDAHGQPIGRVLVQYGRQVAATEATVKRVELFLVLGVLAGSLLALLRGHGDRAAGDGSDRDADLDRRRDRAHARPLPRRAPAAGRRRGRRARAHAGGDASRARRGALGDRVDARPPAPVRRRRLTRAAHAADERARQPRAARRNRLHGDQGEAARSALRSSQRMRRLVADLLLLARSDAARVVAREPCDLGQIVVEAAAELGPVSAAHEISLDIHPAMVVGARDELHRLTINLLENALRHTPRRDGDPRIDRDRRRRERASGRRGRRSRVSRALCADACSSASCAARATAAAPSAWAWRSSRRWPCLTAAASRSSDRRSARRAMMRPARASSSRCPPHSDLDDDRQHHRPSLETVID